MRELVMRNRKRVKGRRRVVVVLLMIDGVVPERGTGIEAEPGGGKIELRIEIEAVGNDARLEAAVAIIRVPVRQQERIGAAEPDGGAVFQRIVPAQLRIAGAVKDRGIESARRADLQGDGCGKGRQE